MDLEAEINNLSRADFEIDPSSDEPQEINIEPDTSLQQQLHPSETLHQELSSLRDATRRAIAESYREKERLCRDGEIMQVSNLMSYHERY